MSTKRPLLVLVLALLLVASAAGAAVAGPGSSGPAAAARAATAGVSVPTWVPVTAGAHPPGRGALAYDGVRKDSVLFVPARTGQPSQTWIFDGGSRRWSRVFPATNPPLIDGAVTFDSAAGVAVLIGGVGDLYSCTADNPAQMWTWDGVNWSQQHPATLPSRCSANHLAFDRKRRRVVLLTDDATSGGSTTWLWDGTNWTDSGPGPRAGSAIAYDAGAQRVLAFGGSFFFHGTNFFRDTMGWTGTRWVTSSTGGPSARSGVAMTSDPFLHEAVLFGGTTYNPAAVSGTRDLNDTWRWEGHWIRMGPESSPPAMSGAAFVFDGAHGFAVLHGNGTWLLTTVRRGGGYVVCPRDGGVITVGNARFFGSTGGMRLNQPIVGIASAATRDGYWLAAADGGIFSFGDARFFGSTGGRHLNQPIVGIARTPTRKGYWLVARDGGVFAFGDARFLGSTGGMHLNQQIVGMAATPTGDGYWLVARDGGVFTFGDARFHGSGGGSGLQFAGIATTPPGDGYWLVTRTGSVFAFGAAEWHGDLSYSRPAVAILASPRGKGYWVFTDDGYVKSFGDAPPHSTVTGIVTSPIVAATST